MARTGEKRCVRSSRLLVLALSVVDDRHHRVQIGGGANSGPPCVSSHLKRFLQL